MLDISRKTLGGDNNLTFFVKKKLTKDSTEIWIYVTTIPQTTFSQSPKNLSNDYKTAVVFKDKMLVGFEG